MKFKSDKCGYCSACVSVCHHKILIMNEWQLIINEGCHRCRNCVMVCPFGAIE